MLVSYVTIKYQSDFCMNKGFKKLQTICLALKIKVYFYSKKAKFSNVPHIIYTKNMGESPKSRNIST